MAGAKQKDMTPLIFAASLTLCFICIKLIDIHRELKRANDEAAYAREWMAAEALSGILANPRAPNGNAAEEAVKQADALIEALNKE